MVFSKKEEESVAEMSNKDTKTNNFVVEKPLIHDNELNIYSHGAKENTNNDIQVGSEQIFYVEEDKVVRYNLKKLVVFIIGLVVLLLYVWFKVLPNKENDTVNSSSVVSSSSTKVNAIPVTVEKIGRIDFSIIESTIGTVLNLDVSSISSQTSGIVDNIYFNIGDQVSDGDIIATIRNEEAENNIVIQEAEINRVKAMIANIRKTKDRYDELIKDGFISQAQLDEINTQLATYEEDLARAVVLLENSKIKLSNNMIKSDITGIIQDRHVSIGSFVSVSSPIVDLVDSIALTVIASLPEKFSYQLEQGQPVILKIPDTEIEISSEIKDLRPVISEINKSVSIIIEIPSNSYGLKPGATLEVDIFMEKKENVIAVDNKSVVSKSGGNFVYQLNEDYTVTEKAVVTGDYYNGMVEIVSGLNGDETIVFEGADFLSDNANVIIR